jgi:hypothetical protein
MLGVWLEPLMAWLGLDILGLIGLVIIIILIVKD